MIVHNHELTRIEWKHYHRSERVIGDVKSERIIVMTKALMRSVVQYRYDVYCVNDNDHLIYRC